MVESYKTLVFGASLNPDRYSYKAILMLRKTNIPVVAFGLKYGVVCDVEIDTNLELYRSIHTVTLYLNPKRQLDYMEYILNLNPKRVILIQEQKILIFSNFWNSIIFHVKCLALWYYCLRINTNPRNVRSPLRGKSS